MQVSLLQDYSSNHVTDKNEANNTPSHSINMKKQRDR